METTAGTFTVKTSTFEGPLDLLLSLIESRKLFINEIALSEVTNDFIEFTKRLESYALSDVANFVVIAATLLLIKSRSLLPGLSLTPDEEEKIVDLEQRLKKYQKIKEVSIFFSKNFGRTVLYHSPDRSHIETPLFVPHKDISVPNLYGALNDVIARLPKKEQTLPEVTMKKVMSIEEMITGLSERIQNTMKVSFKSIAHAHDAIEYKERKVYVIVTFLAMLELVRQGIMDVIQESDFSDMEMVRTERGLTDEISE